MPISTGTRSAAADRAMSGATGGDPDVGIRNYRSGDDIRTIHWRASARHDELMVRLEEPVSHGGAVVMLDHRARAHAGEGAGLQPGDGGHPGRVDQPAPADAPITRCG